MLQVVCMLYNDTAQAADRACSNWLCNFAAMQVGCRHSPPRGMRLIVATLASTFASAAACAQWRMSPLAASATQDFSFGTQRVACKTGISPQHRTFVG